MIVITVLHLLVKFVPNDQCNVAKGGQDLRLDGAVHILSACGCWQVFS